MWVFTSVYISSRAYIFVYSHVNIHMWIHIYWSTRVYSCKPIWIHIYIRYHSEFIRFHIWIHIYIWYHSCIHTWVFKCEYRSTRVYSCIHIWIHIYIWYRYDSCTGWRRPTLYDIFISIYDMTRDIFISIYDMTVVQGGEDPYDALSRGLLSVKEPLITGLFCGKWPLKIRHAMGLCHPASRSCDSCMHMCDMTCVWMSYVTYINEACNIRGGIDP